MYHVHTTTRHYSTDTLASAVDLLALLVACGQSARLVCGGVVLLEYQK